MTDTILNPDGSVYMTFGPSVPSKADLEGWCVRSVTSAHSTPERCHFDGTRWVGTGRLPGTVALTSTDCLSFNGLLRDLGELETIYGYRPRSSKITTDTYRWTFERVTPDGHRVSDMIIASKIH